MKQSSSWRRPCVPAALAVAASLCLAAPAAWGQAAVGEGGATLRSVIVSGGGVSTVGNLTLVTATGQAAVVGRRDLGPVILNTGWVSPNSDRLAARDIVINEVRIEAVGPDMALVRVDAQGHVAGEIRFGQGIELGSSQEVDGELVRLSGLRPGELYRYKVVLSDRLGRIRASSELRFCTPGAEELVRGRVQATYYRGRELDEAVSTRSEPLIRQPEASDGNPLGDFGSGAGPDEFSASWQGLIELTRDGEYLWLGTSDDGQRLVLDGETLIEDWQERPNSLTRRASHRSTAGWHLLRYDFFSGQGAAVARVRLGGGDVRLGDLPAAKLAYIQDEFYEPTIVERDDAIRLECASPLGSERVELPSPEVFDCFDGAVAVRSDAPGRFPQGETRVVWSARNSQLRTARMVEFVTVEDSRPPVVTPPAKVSREASSPLGTPVGVPEVEVADLCDVEPEITHHVCRNDAGDPCLPCFSEADEREDARRTAGRRDPACGCEAAPSRYPLGSTLVTAVATDAAGNCGSAHYEVEVTDTTPPSVDAGQAELAQCAEFRIPSITVRDNATPADRIRVTCQTEDDELPGACDRWVDLGFGDHRISVVAVDEAGNRREDEVVVVQARDQIDTAAPEVLVDASPDGWLSGDGEVVAQVIDACDREPTLTFDPEAASVVLDAGTLTYTATYSAEGVYRITAIGTDASDNLRTAAVPAFGIDLTPPEARFTTLDEVDVDDEAAWGVYFPGDEIAFDAGGREPASDGRSGLARLDAVLIHLDADPDDPGAPASADAPRVVLAEVFEPDDSDPPEGPNKIKDLACDEQVPPGQSAMCTGGGDIDVRALAPGRWQLLVTATDAAGNQATTERYFHVLSWQLAIERAQVQAELLLDEDADPAPGVVTALLLGQITEHAAAAVHAIGHPDLIGNALLYTYSFAFALEFAQLDGFDVADVPSQLAKGAHTTITDLTERAARRLQDDDADILLAEEFLEASLEDISADNFQAALLGLQNAWFHVLHAKQPYDIESWDDARDASSALRLSLNAYEDLGEDDANGVPLVAAIARDQRNLVSEGLFNVALGGDRAIANPAFLRLLVTLANMSDAMSDAQDHWVWVRNWQWPVSLQVREVAGMGIELVATALGDDPESPDDPLLAYARTQYDAGVDFIGDRLVDDALALYVDERCLIFEVYNHGGFDPQGTPPEGWACPDCVLTGDCDHPDP